MYQEIEEQARKAAEELVSSAKCGKGDLFIVGCSSSEVLGQAIGTGSSLEAAEAILKGIHPVLQARGIFLAAQCCEHLNRAIILEDEAARLYHLEQVNVIPQPKAGGSFATACYHTFSHPVAVEGIQAKAGMDIGGTLIGMHLKKVAVPVRLSVKQIGEAALICARTRPKFVGGNRACYDDSLL